MREGGREEGRKEGRKERRKEGRKEGTKFYYSAAVAIFLTDYKLEGSKYRKAGRKILRQKSLFFNIRET